MNPTVIGNWFKLLKEVEDKAEIISPDQIWSGDETGTQNVPKEVKVLGMKNIRRFQQVSTRRDFDRFIFRQCRRKGVPAAGDSQGPMSRGHMVP